MNVDSIVRQCAWLRKLRAVPLHLELSELCGLGHPPVDLLPFLLEAWRRSQYKQRTLQQRRQAERMLVWLETQLAQHAAVTWDVPGDNGHRVREWIGPRLVWWPRGLPQGLQVGVVSSRLGRDLEHQRAWFAALRHTCEKLNRDCTSLVAVEKTSPFPFLERCSELFQVPLLRFELPAAKQSVVDWFVSRPKIAWQKKLSSELTWPAWVSPALEVLPECATPLRDRLVIAASDRVVVLGMRPGGHIEQLVQRRWTEHAAKSNMAISLAVGPDLVPEQLAENMPGALRLTLGNPLARGVVSVPEKEEAHPDTIVSLNQFSGNRFLIHCTRQAVGPWPDQSMDEYRDALILGRDEVDHSALATLARIASQKKLLATGQAIRGGAQVVCFTSVAIDQLRDLRTFRAHRGRWDFEPYGICIEREWLEQQGVRPVCYGDSRLWEQLAKSDRPFFQRRRAGKRDQFDWAVECEWRHRGDVDLADLPRDAAVLFVPTVEEAQRLRSQSYWPVAVLD